MARNKTLKNGRNAGKLGGFSTMPVDMQKSPAFQSLSASALRLLLWFIFKSYKAGTQNEKIQRPVFKVTNREALAELGMSAQTFSRAKQELADKGFMEWVKRGGLRGANGVASEFALSDEWKSWTASPKGG